jgi:hypothetical protein
LPTLIGNQPDRNKTPADAAIGAPGTFDSCFQILRIWLARFESARKKRSSCALLRCYLMRIIDRHR